MSDWESGLKDGGLSTGNIGGNFRVKHLLVGTGLRGKPHHSMGGVGRIHDAVRGGRSETRWVKGISRIRNRVLRRRKQESKTLAAGTYVWARPATKRKRTRLEGGTNPLGVWYWADGWERGGHRVTSKQVYCWP